MMSLMAMDPYFFAEQMHDAYGVRYLYGACEDCGCETFQQPYDCDECPYDDRPIIGVYCPCCGEPIYFEDYDNVVTKGWTVCPICEFEDWENAEKEEKK